MKTNLRERLTRYQCVIIIIRPKVHFAPEFSFIATQVKYLFSSQHFNFPLKYSQMSKSCFTC